MVEMTETAAILHSSTPRSLVLLDEIGRGTATFDGLSIAWAVAEYLHDSPEHAAKTLFATHYHELTELAERLPGAQNYQITAAEREGEVVFLHRLERGRVRRRQAHEAWLHENDGSCCAVWCARYGCREKRSCLRTLGPD